MASYPSFAARPRLLVLWIALVVATGSLTGPAGTNETETVAPAVAAENPPVHSNSVPAGPDPATLLAIEKMREATEAAARQHAAILESRLKGIEDQVARQREREFQAMQKANRTLLVGIAGLVTLGVIGTALMGIFMFRSVHRLAEAVVQSHSRPASGLLGLESEPRPYLSGIHPVDPSTTRLLAAIDHLEKRIGEMEQTAAPKLSLGNGHSETRSTSANAPVDRGSDGGHEAPPRAPLDNLRLLMEKGESLLVIGQIEAALTCFEEVARLRPGHAEAHLKRGLALEKLDRLDEALESLNRAVRLDASLATAHLCRGSVLNRLARHEEALRSYDEALRAGKPASGSP